MKNTAIQHQKEIQMINKEQRQVILRDAGVSVDVSAEDALAMKAELGIPLENCFICVADQTLPIMTTATSNPAVTRINGTGLVMLQGAFEEFKRSKNAMAQIHKDTLECFKKIDTALGSHKHGQELAHELAAEMSMSRDGIEESMIKLEIAGTVSGLTKPLSEVLYTKEEREEVSTLFSQSPALIVVGQTNSGKSSIINEILKKRIVTTSDQPCTSRIVKLTYSSENYVRLVSRKGTVLERHAPKKMKIPREIIELRESDRENPERVTAIIEAGFNIPFLKSGVDIIDSPGRDENKVLDELVREQLDNILPFIVYVIDGHNLFTALDRTVLEEITERKKDLDIFYVVSKIEPQDQDSSEEEDEEEDEDEDEDDDDDDDDDDEYSQETVQDNKKRRVFEQLVKNGLMTDDKPINEHEHFHGLSAWKLSQYRRKNNKDPNWEDPDEKYKEYTEAFERFQSCLKTFSESSLKASIWRSCQTLISVLSRCMYYFIEKANSLKQHRDNTVSMLQKIEAEENIVHGNVLQSVEKQRLEIIDVMKEAVLNLEDTISKKASTFRYSEEFNLPMSDGYVKGKVVKQCRKQIRNMVSNAVLERIKETLMNIFSTRDIFYEILQQRVKEIEEEAASDENVGYGASKALHGILIKCYKVNPHLKTTKTFRQVISSWKEATALQFFKVPLKVLSERVKVGNPEWKSKVAVDTLRSIQIPDVANALISNIKRHFESCHDQFNEMLKNIVRVCNRGGTLRDEQRKVIHSFAPDVASLEMHCQSISDRVQFGIPLHGEMIGTGTQGNVFTCTNILTPEGKPCVVKVVPVASESLLKDLTIELHTTRSISHPNILPIVCTCIEPISPTGIRVAIVSERMKCDLHNALKDIPSLRTRLKLLLDVALALQYLHRRGLMHRDVKLQNVLVDENNRGYLTDFGLCKPEGLASGSLVGTPIAMAPEMITKQYNKFVDVYAFGVLMWRVCEGQGNQPKNIFLCQIPRIMLAVNAKEQRKPERLDIFLPSCWNLMEKCWGEDPDERPSFDEIVNDLEDILADKSIK